MMSPYAAANDVYPHMPKVYIMSEATALPKATSIARQGKHRNKKSTCISKCLFLLGGDCWTRTSDLLRVKQAL